MTDHFPPGIQIFGLEYSSDVVNGKETNMLKAGIIDPVLVTKTALKNAVSVVSTIISADCVISNMRMNAGDK